MTDMVSSGLDATTLSAIIDGRHSDPFAVLGPHEEGGAVIIRAFVPAASRMEVIDSGTGASVAHMTRIAEPGFFEVELRQKPVWFGYRLRASNDGGSWEFDDPYRFGPVLGDIDDHLIREGTHQRLWERLGAHVTEHQQVPGVAFAVWAPSASRVAVTGDFNDWDGRRHPMRNRRDTGIWEIFIPGVAPGAL
ncbi:MAG: 1,4-alpha-glucan branching enzyme, partial [Rhodospirillales bacterium]|nr:1,4-alpha-glucan branching enzyme [Rhodospirillales bacterium]